MFQGELVGIFITARKAHPMAAVDSVTAVAGCGLIGDRYGAKEGTFSGKDGPDHEVTLIESEAIAALLAEYEIALAPEESRRNLLTRGVPLNHLVGVEFLVGDVRLKGLRLCEPCGHLEKLTRAGVRKGLIHRGGLRSQVLRGGTLRRGDPIRLPG